MPSSGVTDRLPSLPESGKTKLAQIGLLATGQMINGASQVPWDGRGHVRGQADAEDAGWEEEAERYRPTSP